MIFATATDHCRFGADCRAAFARSRSGQFYWDECPTDELGSLLHQLYRCTIDGTLAKQCQQIVREGPVSSCANLIDLGQCLVPVLDAMLMLFPEGVPCALQDWHEMLEAADQCGTAAQLNYSRQFAGPCMSLLPNMPSPPCAGEGCTTTPRAPYTLTDVPVTHLTAPPFTHVERQLATPSPFSAAPKDAATEALSPFQKTLLSGLIEQGVVTGADDPKWAAIAKLPPTEAARLLVSTKESSGDAVVSPSSTPSHPPLMWADSPPPTEPPVAVLQSVMSTHPEAASSDSAPMISCALSAAILCSIAERKFTSLQNL